MFTQNRAAMTLLCALGAWLNFFGNTRAAPAVVWEVENRFRLYKTSQVFRNYAYKAETAGTAADSNWVLKTERILQDGYRHGEPDFMNGTSESRGDRMRWNGWASLWRNETCWDRQRFRFISDDRCEDYVV